MVEARRSGRGWAIPAAAVLSWAALLPFQSDIRISGGAPAGGACQDPGEPNAGPPATGPATAPAGRRPIPEPGGPPRVAPPARPPAPAALEGGVPWWPFPAAAALLGLAGGLWLLGRRRRG